MANENNGRINFASEQNIGRSRQRGALEDRMRVGEAQTGGGLTLTLAVVADGVGGGNYGERAAQLVIDTVFEVVQRAEVSRPEQLPALLNQALVQANRAIFQEANQNKQVRGMGSTATIVAIHNNQLYLANAGDSRAYLIRAKQVYQLTRDHTWANEMVQLGRLTPDKAQAHPKAHELVRSVGFENDLKVDLGLYAPLGQNGDIATQGLPLQTGDRLVVCSDGLIKERHDAPGNYVEPAEMRQIVTTLRPAAAAKALVQKALDREVDDNVSAIVLEMPGSRRAFALPRPVPYIVVGLLLLACLAFGAMRLLAGTGGDSTATPSSVADNGSAAPTATATLRSTPEACQAAVFEAAGDAQGSQPGSGFQPLAVGNRNRLPIGQGVLVQAGSGPLELVLSDGSQLFIAAGSELGLNQAAGCGDKTETVLQLNHGQMVVDLTGAAGHLVTVRNPLGGQVQSDGGLFGVAYQETKTLFEVDCFGGTCTLRDIGGELSLSNGQYSRMGGAGVPSQPEPARSDSYCELASRIIPCPTATATGVPTLTPSVTWTPEPTGTPRPTNTPLPAPTFTPSPTPSITPSPSITPTPTATLPPGVTPSITPTLPPGTTPPPTTPPPTTPPPTTPPPTTPPPTTPPPTTPPPTTPPPTTPPPTTPPPTTPPPTTPPPTTPPPTTPPPTTPPPTTPPPTPTETRGTPPTPTPSDTPIPPTETRVPTETPPPPPTPCENPPCP